MRINRDELSGPHPLLKLLRAGRNASGTEAIGDETQLYTYRELSEDRSEMVSPIKGLDYVRTVVAGVNTLVVLPEEIKDENKIIYYCHGGGFNNGGLSYASVIAGKLARQTGYVVYAHQYSLSPDNPYPAAVNETVAVWEELIRMEYEPKDIIVTGDSAGGNLALELCLELKKKGEELPGALVLISPWTDMTCRAPSYERYKDLDPMLTREYIEQSREYYMGDRTDPKSPDFSPLYGDLTGFPPTLIQVGSYEILRSDSERLARKLRRLGVHTQYHVYRGCWHVFHLMPIPKANRAVMDIGDFISNIFDTQEKSPSDEGMDSQTDNNTESTEETFKVDSSTNKDEQI